MDISLFLDPVPDKCFVTNNRPGKNTFGETLTIFKDEEDFPDLEGFQLALVGIKEERGAVDNHGCADGADYIRKAFYQLFNHWTEIKIVDLGNVKTGQEISDTYYALNQVLTELMKAHILPIIIGGSQDMTYPMYQVYEPTGKLVNITADRKSVV